MFDLGHLALIAGMQVTQERSGAIKSAIAEIKRLRNELATLHKDQEIRNKQVGENVANLVDECEALRTENADLKHRLLPIDKILTTKGPDGPVLQAGIDLVTGYEDEVTDLKRRLAVYEEGRPNEAMLRLLAFYCSESCHPECLDAERWLNRIAAVREPR